MDDREKPGEPGRGAGAMHTMEVQESTDARDAEAPERRGLLGEILVREGLITEAQLEHALLVQRETEAGTPLGQILVRQNAITQRQLNTVLDRYHKKYRLGDILVETETITEHQLQIALDHQKRTGLRLGDVLLQLNFVTEEELNQALCKQFGVTFVDLDRLVLDRSLAVLIDREHAERHRVIPISKTDRALVVAMDDPSDLRVVAELAARHHCRVNVVTSTHASFRRAFTRTYGETAEEGLIRRAEEATRAYEALRLEHGGVLEQLNELRRAHASVLTEREASARLLAEQRTRNELNQRALDELRDAHARLRDELAAARAELEAVRAEHVGALEALTALEQRHGGLDAEREASAEEHRRQRERNDCNERALEELRQVQEALRAEHAALQAELAAARAAGAAGLDRLRAAHEALIQQRDELVRQLEAVLARLSG